MGCRVLCHTPAVAAGKRLPLRSVAIHDAAGSGVAVASQGKRFISKGQSGGPGDTESKRAAGLLLREQNTHKKP